MSVATLSRRRARRPISLALRARMEAAVDALLALLDEADGDPEAEPSLGSPGHSTRQHAWAQGVTDDREQTIDGADDEREGDDADREPSLGWRETREGSNDHGALAMGLHDDLEDEHDGREREVPRPRCTIGRRASDVPRVYSVEDQATALAVDLVCQELGLRRASDNVTLTRAVDGSLTAAGPYGGLHRLVDLRRA